MSTGINYVDTLSRVTKKIYDNEKVVDQMFLQAPFFKSLKPNTMTLGTDVTFAIAMAGSQGIGVRDGDQEPVPDAGAPWYETPSYDFVRNFLHLEITEKAVARTKDKVRALAGQVYEIVEREYSLFNMDWEFQCFGRPSPIATITSGLRGVVQSAVSAGTNATITLAAPFVPINHIAQNMLLDFYNETTGQKVCTGRVGTVNRLAGTFTIVDLPKDLAGNEYIYRGGNASNRNREITGLNQAINDATGNATYLGLTSTGMWQSAVYGNSGVLRPATFDLFDQAYYTAGEQNNEEPDELWTNWQGLRSLINMHQRVVVQNVPSGRGKGITLDAKGNVEYYGNAKVNTSTQCTPNTHYFLIKRDVRLQEERPFAWLTDSPADAASNIMWHKVPGYTKWEATAVQSLQLILKRRNLHAVLTDIE